MVIPIGDINPTRRRPHANWALLAINLGVFVWQHLLLDPCEGQGFLYRFALVPQEVLALEGLPASTVGQSLGSCAVPGSEKWVVFTLVTSMFLHADIWHLLGNLLFLFVFGDNVEDRLGHARYVLFYLAAGVIAALAYSLVRPGSVAPLIGASGAVAAVLGAYLIMHPRAKVLTYVPFPLYLLAWLIPGVRIRVWLVIFAIMNVPAWLLLGGWFAYQFLAVQDPGGGNVAYEAHIAGFVAGIIAILIIDAGRTRGGRSTLHPVRDRRWSSRGRRR